MERISISFSGRLGRDPRLSETRNGKPMVTMTVAAEARQDGQTRWFTVRAFNNLAVHAAASLHKGDRVTVKGDDVEAYIWKDQQSGEARSGLGVTAYEIGASVMFDNLQTSRAAKQSDADDHFGIDAAQAADLSVLNGTQAADSDTDDGSNLDLMAGVNGR